MNFLQENALKYTSVKWPLIGAFLLGVIPVLLQEGINTQLIPAEYHSLILTIVLPALAYFGKKKYQPELHPEPTILGFAKLPVDSITFDEAFRRLIGHEGGYTNDKRDPGNWTFLSCLYGSEHQMQMKQTSEKFLSCLYGSEHRGMYD